MSCCKKKRAERTVTLTFEREQLLYDVSNAAYVESDLIDEGGEHARHVTADITEAGNVDRITRIFDQVHAQAEESLYPYTRRYTSRDSILSDMLSESAGYVIELRVPEHFSDTTARLLQTLIHEWFVASALGGWLGMTNERASMKWLARAEELRKEVERGKNSHAGVLRRKLSTF